MVGDEKSMQNMAEAVRNSKEKVYSKEGFIKELETHIPRIFEMLNCYEVDARNITNGMTYLDSGDAQRLARNIIQSIQENL